VFRPNTAESAARAPRSASAGKTSIELAGYSTPETVEWPVPQILPSAPGDNACRVEKRLELVLPGEWTVDEAHMLSEGVRIRVL
jgi:hypothetical protein